MATEHLLKKIDLFKELSSQSRNALASICLKKAIKKKEVLFFEGDQGKAIFLLEEGAIQLHKTTPEGKEVVIRVIQPGELFAEVTLFEETEYPVTATALKKSTIHVLPKTKFLTLLDQENFRNDFIRNLLKKQRYLTNRIVYLTSHDVEKRFFLFLKSYFGPQEKITPTISKKDIAAIIGTTPETFSRMLLKMKEEGRLVWKDKQIKLSCGFWEK